MILELILSIFQICAYTKVAYLFDHPGTVFYAVFMSFWGENNTPQLFFPSGDIPGVLEAEKRKPGSPVGLHGIPGGR